MVVKVVVVVAGTLGLLVLVGTHSHRQVPGFQVLDSQDNQDTPLTGD